MRFLRPCAAARVLSILASVAIAGDADSLLAEAMRNYESGDYKNARGLLESARLKVDCADVERVVHVETLLGVVCLGLRDFDSALRHLALALEKRQGLLGRDHPGLVQLWSMLAYGQAASGRNLDAALSLATAHTLAVRLGATGRADVYKAGSAVATGMGYSALSLAFARRAKVLVETSGKAELIADAAHVVGKRAFAVGDFELCAASLKLSQRLGDERAGKADRKREWPTLFYLLRAGIHGRAPDVERDIRNAMAFCKSAFGVGSLEYAGAVSVLAEAMTLSGRTAAARSVLVTIADHKWGGSNAEQEVRALQETVLGRTDVAKAEVHLANAIAFYKKLRGHQDAIANLWLDVAAHRARTGNARDAVAPSMRAVELFQNGRGLLDASARESMRLCADYARQAGDSKTENTMRLELANSKNVANAASPKALAEARRLIAGSKLRAAEATLDAALRQAPADRKAQFLALLVCHRRKDDQGLVRLADRIIARDPLSPAAYFFKSVGESGLGDHERAIFDATIALLLDPTMRPPSVIRAGSWLLRGDPLYARLDLDAAVAEAPKRTSLLMLRVQAFMALGSWDDAVADLRRVRALDQGKAPEIDISLGDVFFARGEHVRAAESYTRAREHGSESANGRLAIVHLIGGDYQEALGLMKPWREGMDTTAFVSRWICLRRLGRHQESREFVQRVASSAGVRRSTLVARAIKTQDAQSLIEIGATPPRPMEHAMALLCAAEVLFGSGDREAADSAIAKIKTYGYHAGLAGHLVPVVLGAAKR